MPIPLSTLSVDVRVPIFLVGKVGDDMMKVEFGRFHTVAGWIRRTDEDRRWFGAWGVDLDRDELFGIGHDAVTERCENRREAARLLVLDFLGGNRPPKG